MGKRSTEKDERLGLKELVAIGIGSMIGGGIFSVMGLAHGISGHATALVFVIGGVIALFAGYNYAKLALTYREDGASQMLTNIAKEPSFRGFSHGEIAR